MTTQNTPDSVGSRPTIRSVYLAGPDVFHPDAQRLALTQKTLCRHYGFEPHHPFDQTALSSRDIFHTNIDMIRRADAVLANLNPFRGPEVDSGTAFEVGFAKAQGKVIIGYVSSTESLMQRVQRLYGEIRYCAEETLWRDEQDHLVEDFGHSVNLMLAESCASIVAGGLEAALIRLRECCASQGT